MIDAPDTNSLLAFRERINNIDPIWILLVFIGVLWGTTHLTVASDDLLGYWGAAIHLTNYPGIKMDHAHIKAGSVPVLVRYPVMPVLLWIISFIEGYTTLVLYSLIGIPAVLFPLIYYRALTQLEVGAGISLFITLSIYLFPPIQLYGFGSAEPDPLFLTLLALLLLIFGLGIKNEERKTYAIMLGLAAGITALTRPEGIIYSTPVLGWYVYNRKMGKISVIPFVILALPWIMLSYSYSKTVWMTGNTLGAFSPFHITKNIILFIQNTWQHSQVLFIILGGAGLAFLVLVLFITNEWHQGRLNSIPIYTLFLAIPPALNASILVLLDPQITYVIDAPSFIRHGVYMIPYVGVVLAIFLKQMDVQKRRKIISLCSGGMATFIPFYLVPGVFYRDTRTVVHLNAFLQESIRLYQPSIKRIDSYYVLETQNYLNWREFFLSTYRIYNINVASGMSLSVIVVLCGVLGILVFLFARQWL